jgi:UDPglucose--hexose-1-phosphate uridylyltransferase
VVPNKFPALTPEAGREREQRDGFLAMPGRGHHEVIIESPRHDWDLATATHPEVRAVLAAYRARYRALRAAGDSALIVVFRNHGPGSGTSLEHPHSQVLAAPVVPLQVRRRLDVARQHFDDLGTCLYAEVIDGELGDGRRVLTAGERVVAFQPFAAAVPFETWILPRSHQPSFGQAGDGLLDELAGVLRSVLQGLRVALEDPPTTWSSTAPCPGTRAASTSSGTCRSCRAWPPRRALSLAPGSRSIPPCLRTPRPPFAPPSRGRVMIERAGRPGDAMVWGRVRMGGAAFGQGLAGVGVVARSG